MGSWFVPPVVMPIVLLVLLGAYAALRAMSLKTPWSATAPEVERRPRGHVAAARAKGWKRGWQIWLGLNATELTWTALLIGLILFVNLFTAR